MNIYLLNNIYKNYYNNFYMDYEYRECKRIRLNKKSNKQLNKMHTKILELENKISELEFKNKQLNFINIELLEKLNQKSKTEKLDIYN